MFFQDNSQLQICNNLNITNNTRTRTKICTNHFQMKFQKYMIAIFMLNNKPLNIIILLLNKTINLMSTH